MVNSISGVVEYRNEVNDNSTEFFSGIAGAEMCLQLPEGPEPTGQTQVA